MFFIPYYFIQASLRVCIVNPSKRREQGVLRWLINRIQFFEISLFLLWKTPDHTVDGCVFIFRSFYYAFHTKPQCK